VKAVGSLVEDLSRSTAWHEGFHLYVFGSATRSGATPNDVDLLLVYADGLLEDAHALAEEIRSTLAAPPYDVLVASETEEAQLNFIATQEAVLILPAGQPGSCTNAQRSAEQDYLGSRPSSIYRDSTPHQDAPG
jgi:predicted nucleotidyltransferase